MIAAATETDQELSLFAGWLREGLLPLNSDELAHYDPIIKSLHAQWERFNLKEGVIYRRYWEGRKENYTWQILSSVEYCEEKRAYWVGGRDTCAIFAGGVTSTRNTTAGQLRNRANSKICA